MFKLDLYPSRIGNCALFVKKTLLGEIGHSLCFDCLRQLEFAGSYFSSRDGKSSYGLIVTTAVLCHCVAIYWLKFWSVIIITTLGKK